jgi:glycosyltransferase involved in cell wall biosynthesis
MEQCSVFVMPSRVEPWGVVLHEFAAAGFPVICSDAVGASEVFIKEGENGYIYEAGNIEALKMCLNQITSQPVNRLQEMGQNSVKLAMEITPDKWAKTVMALVSEKISDGTK